MTEAPVRKPVRYGVEFQHELGAEVLYELALFKNAPALIARHPSYTGEGRWHHLQRVHELLFRDVFDMHEWAADMLEMFCDNRESTVTGPKSASKTNAAALYALVFWASSPTDTGVILTSTTLDGLKKRVFRNVRELFHAMQRVRIGKQIYNIVEGTNLVDSKTCIQNTKGDSVHGLFGLAVAQGQTERALGRIIGYHPKNLLIVVDEATDTPEAIDEACANLDKVAGEFQIIRLGNARSRFDPHGKSCEPKDGWDSITSDDEYWETRFGACLHLDGRKSPGIKNPKKYPYLLNEQDLKDTAKRYNGDNSPGMWRFAYGFWAPSGVENTVFSETMFLKFKAREAAEWLRTPHIGAALDPAFGGDRCILRVFRWGECRDGRLRIEFGEKVPIELQADSETPVDYQIARQVRESCKARGIEPRNFGTDSTGSGRGVAAILRREWSNLIKVVEFTGAATTRQLGRNNPLACNQEYKFLVTELWYAFRVFLEADQIRGLEDATVKEFCIREYRMVSGNLVQVEMKDEMKKRTKGVSPDDADASVVAIEVLRRLGVVAEDDQGPIDPDASDEKDLEYTKQFDLDAHEDCYLDPSL